MVRTTLLSIDCAVSEEPAVWTWKRHIIERGLVAPKRSAMIRRPHPSRDPELGDLLEQFGPRREEERQATREVIDVEAPVDRCLDVGDGIGQGERQLLGRGRPGLAHVVAGDRDGVPLRELAGAELEDVGHEPHRRAWREDVRASGDVLLEDVVLGRPADPRAVDPWASAAAT